ncbi:MAG: PLP-dependent aminotransferase family protein [Alphaproteobacteria bacterium]|nr:PLP-dependent aminotransferase family protein [Alphaproteobacteria bacterium]
MNDLNAMMPLKARARAAGAALWAPALDRNAPLPLSRQLAAALRAAIAEGQLGAGARLPSTRVLAAELELARSTVVAVFEQLAAEGYIAAQPGSGYFVPAGFAAGDVTADPGGREEKPGPAARTISRPGSRPVSQHGAALRELIIEARSSPRPFQSGHADIDPRLVGTWKRLASRALSGRSRLNWDYGDPQGEPVLRQAIADYLAAARGVRCRPDQIVLTSGTQQGLSLAARVLLDAGDTAWVEDPCYRAALDILRDAGARIVPVAVDEHGLDIAAAPPLASEVGRTPPRLVYTTPSRQYPLGMAMPLARRMALLAWAEAAGAWIIRGRLRERVPEAGADAAVIAGARPRRAGHLSRHVQQTGVPGIAARLRGIAGRPRAAIHGGAPSGRPAELVIAAGDHDRVHARRALRTALEVHAPSLCRAAAISDRRGGAATLRDARDAAAGLRHVSDRRIAGGVVGPRRGGAIGRGRDRRAALVDADLGDAAAPCPRARLCRAQRGGDRARHRAHGRGARLSPQRKTRARQRPRADTTTTLIITAIVTIAVSQSSVFQPAMAEG